VAAVTLTIPFYDGGVRYGLLRDAQLALEQADERLEAVRRRVRVEVRDGWRRVAIAERQLRIAERQAEVARRAATAAEEMFRVGNLTGLELDAARRAAEQAELARVLAELELQVARVDLLTSTGDL
ncbi:MAG TPA: TolC family protein, partial [Thermodesulfobacteriota bacterium]